MAKRRLWPIWLAVAVFAVAIPLFLVFRKKRMTDELEAWLAETGYQEVACPAADFFGRRDMNKLRCFDGKLGGSKPITLILGTRWQSETANVPKGSGIAQESYIALQIEPPGPQWAENWAKRLGRGGDDPVWVARGTNRASVAWRGLHRRADVQKRIDTIAESLR